MARFVALLCPALGGRYGSSCELVIAVKGQGVHGFTLDPHVGEFILTKPYMKIPKVGLHRLGITLTHRVLRFAFVHHPKCTTKM